MSSLKYEVIIPRQLDSNILQKFADCLPNCIIPIIASNFVILPFNHCENTQHDGGKVAY